jgi:hypothetical protein
MSCNLQIISRRPLGFAAVAALLLAPTMPASAQTPQRLNENCIVSVLNRNTRVRPDGSWILPNIPANFGLVRARATCVFNGLTISGESAPFLISANNSVNVPPIILGPTTPIPTAVDVTAPGTVLNQIGATRQLTVTAHYAGNVTHDVTAGSTGTTYVISNPAIASATSDGLIQALSSGTVLIQATNEGTSGFIALQVVLTGDSDGDGIPDDVELANGLNPNNAADAFEDPDHDGLSNLQEYQLGTNMHNADSDGDGLTDGQEVQRGTNPAIVDTDGDGISDGLEVATGSDPLNSGSINLAAALTSISAAPDHFTIIVNSVEGVAYTQLRVTGNLTDGRTIDLTSTLRGTNYGANDLNICNFGAPDGRVFGGQPGACVITITNNGHQTSVSGTVTGFTPISLGSVAIPGYANNVDVNGSYAYVAAGSAGLIVVNVANPSNPVIVASLDTPGNANDVRVVGNTAYVADGPAGLRIIDVTNPLQPVLRGVFDTPGEANDVFVAGAFAYVADGSTGLQIISIGNPSAPLLVRSVDTPGTARGVSVSGNIAVIADDSPSAGVRVINITNPATASIIGSVNTGSTAIDIDLDGGYAYLASYTDGTQIVDVRNPAAPVVVGGLPGSAPSGFVPRDVQVAGHFAIYAEQLFANAVAPIVDITVPTAPVLRGVVDFGQDFAGTGIAVSGQFVYWTGQTFVVSAENGTSGNTRLFIGQYISQQDLAGVPPTITITSPADGALVIEGTPLTVSANATDDVAVASVEFRVNGQNPFTDTSQPFAMPLTVPSGITSLTLSARAIDLGGNIGVAPDVTILVAPDPMTTVIGRVVDANNASVAGATVTVFNQTTTSGPGGTFTISGVPTVQGNIVAAATAVVAGDQLTGASAPVAPVSSGTTDVGTITIVNSTFETDFGTFVTSCDDCFFPYTLPFTFPFYGVNRTQAFVGTNGYITFNQGDSTFTETIQAFSSLPRIAAFFDDLFGRSTGGMYVNTQLPGRFVVTHSTVQHFSFGGSNTLQLTLFQDGRIMFAYKGITATTSGTITGLTPGPNSPPMQVDFTATPNFAVPAGTSVFEYFTNLNPFDLANKAIMFTPVAGGGYSVRVFDLPN